MPLETEIKLELHPQDLSALLDHPLLQQGEQRAQRLLNTYFDTPALELRARRMAVRERRVGRRVLLTVKTAGTSVGGLSRRGEWEVPRPRGPLRFSGWVDDPELAQPLDDLAPRLVPVFHTDFTRRRWVVAHGGAHIEVALDRGAITTGAPRRPRRLPLLELELELLDGPVDALLDLAHTLVLGPTGDAGQALRLRPAQASKAERGYALFAGEALQPVKACAIELQPGMSARQAFVLSALACVEHLLANERGLCDSDGRHALPKPEFVHQARVALRRLRTGLRLFREHLPARWSAHWSAQWKALADALGTARNWDVLATEWLPELLSPEDHSKAAGAVREWVLAQRQQAHAHAAAVVNAPAHALNVLAFTRSVLRLDQPAAQAGQDLSVWANQTLRTAHARLRRRASAALREGPEGRHALRLELKKLRYTQEFLQALLPPKRAARSTEMLADAQTLLGELNDLSTAQDLLRTAPATLAPALMATLQTRLRARLEAGLLALPTMEDSLLRAPRPWR